MLSRLYGISINEVHVHLPLAQKVRMSFGHSNRVKVDCLETGFASRVDETSGAKEWTAMRKTEFGFHRERRSENLHSQCFSDNLTLIKIGRFGSKPSKKVRKVPCPMF